MANLKVTRKVTRVATPSEKKEKKKKNRKKIKSNCPLLTKANNVKEPSSSREVFQILGETFHGDRVEAPTTSYFRKTDNPLLHESGKSRWQVGHL